MRILNLKGQNLNHRFIHLNTGATLNVSNHSINLEKGTVTYNSGSTMLINEGTGITTKIVKFKNNSSSTNLTNATALTLSNPSKVDIGFFTYFENLFTAVEIESSPDTEFIKNSFIVSLIIIILESLVARPHLSRFNLVLLMLWMKVA